MNARVDTVVAPLLRHLFRPITLNRLTLPNRVLMGSIHLNMDELGNQYERKARFYALRAKGGAGLIVTAGCSPNEAGNTSPDGFTLDRDALIPSHALITHAVHREGGRIALQILHFGREAFHGKLVSASPIRLDANLFKPRALSEEDILATIADFAATAKRAVAAGYDAIELIFSQGFLVHQFLAPHTNKRTDRWGGSLENRMRFAIEIAREVRAAVGADFPLLFRIPCLDLLDGGVLPEETLALIEALMPYQIDLLNVSIGWHESDVPTIASVVPRAAYSPVAALIKQRFPHLNVCVSNRINEPRLAEQLLADGCADMVSMARPFLADPNIVAKAQANQFDQINTCIACNQSCLDFVFTGHPVGCSVNPECSDDMEGHIPPFRHQRSIAVIGGGLAGMAAAVYAAKRGAEVSLFERRMELGGQLVMAGRIPKKGEFAETIRYYRNELIALGVRVHLGAQVDPQSMTGFDHIFVATGSTPSVPASLPGVSLPHVLTFEQVLGDQLLVNFPVVVLGGGGVGCDLAKYLALAAKSRYAGARSQLDYAAAHLPASAFSGPYTELRNPPQPVAPVTIIQRSSKKFAYKLGRTTRWILMNELAESGVGLRNGVDIVGITASHVEIVDRKRGQTELVPAATVVLATGQRAESTIAALCQAAGVPHTVIGAASEGAVASITHATTSAYRAVMALD